MEVNIHQAKTHLSRLLQKVSEGEEVLISRAGVPVARLVPAERPAGKRPLGIDRGRSWMSEDFDAPMPEFEKLFYDGPITSPDRPSKKKGKNKRK
jgi:prevent-host-death family protein